MIGADLEIAVAGVGVVDPGRYDDLELREVAREMPFDGAAEIALPDVEYEPHGTEHMRLAELGRALGNGVEMAVVVGTDGAMDASVIRWQVELRRAERARVDAVRVPLVDREDEAHPLV